jgi:DnaJ-class molecular chaperone
MTFKEAREILEVGERYTRIELKKAYRKKAMENHPDLQNGKSEERMKSVNEANDLLEPFALEDKVLEGDCFILDSYVDLERKIASDIYSNKEICKKCSGKGYWVDNVPEYAQCSHCDLSFSLFNGIHSSGYLNRPCRDCRATGQFTLRTGKKVTCRKCKGTGRYKLLCRECNGTGRIKVARAGTFRYQCSECSGTGIIEIKMFNPVIRKGAVLKGKR